MAYGLKYRMQWVAKDKVGNLTIEEEGLSESSLPENLRLVNDAIIIRKNSFENWETHLLGDVCEFNIINDKDDYFELMDLMLAEEKKYRVTVVTAYDSNIYTLFSGYINTEAVNQKYLKYSVIHLVASSYTSKLENVYPVSLSELAAHSLIDIVSEILSQAGNTYPIRVASFLISSGSAYSSNKTFMNQNGLYNEIFWENNVDRTSSEKILQDILTAFQCYMYYWDMCWYIESFEMLHNTTRPYVQYEIGTSYSDDDTGTQYVETFEVNDIHDLVFISMTQTLTVTPGDRTVQVRINNKAFYNLTVNEFYNIVKVGTNVYAPLREWRAFQPMSQTLMVWSAQGLPYQKIVNSIKRTSSYGGGDAPDYPYVYNNTLTTSVKLTVETGTVLQIDFKYALPKSTLDDFGIFNWDKLRVRFRYKIVFRDLVTGAEVGELLRDDDDKLGFAVNFTQNRHLLKRIEGSVFDKTTYTCEFSESYDLPNLFIPVPLNNYLVSFILFPEFLEYDSQGNGNYIEELIPSLIYYGDIKITASIETFDENIIEGVTNTDFLNKKTIEVEIADVPNWNYKNGVLSGASFNLLTSGWYRDEMTERQLVDYILIDKFRMGNVSRQRITGTVKSSEILRPFALFVDSKQNNKKFILTSYVHDVTHDEYEIILDEYDNTTVVNLIEA
jgi:hypothetical protein